MPPEMLLWRVQHKDPKYTLHSTKVEPSKDDHCGMNTGGKTMEFNQDNTAETIHTKLFFCICLNNGILALLQMPSILFAQNSVHSKQTKHCFV